MNNLHEIPEQFRGAYPIHLHLGDEGYHLAEVKNGRLRLDAVHPPIAVPAALGACLLKVALQLAKGKGKRFGITPHDMRGAEVLVSENEGRFKVTLQFPHLPHDTLEKASACCSQVHDICPVGAMLNPDLVESVTFIGGQ
jgi:organic hydroperoxide reductase OsmC/OhrA